MPIDDDFDDDFDEDDEDDDLDEPEIIGDDGTYNDFGLPKGLGPSVNYLIGMELSHDSYFRKLQCRNCGAVGMINNFPDGLPIVYPKDPVIYQYVFKGTVYSRPDKKQLFFPYDLMEERPQAIEPIDDLGEQIDDMLKDLEG